MRDESLEERVSKIEFAIFGDPDRGIDGMSQKMDEALNLLRASKMGAAIFKTIFGACVSVGTLWLMWKGIK